MKILTFKTKLTELLLYLEENNIVYFIRNKSVEVYLPEEFPSDISMELIGGRYL